MTIRNVFFAAVLAGGAAAPGLTAPVVPSAETVEALQGKATGANLLLLREVQACRKSAADPFDCLELMLLAAERDSGYQSTDEQQEGLPSNRAVAAEARKLLLGRYPDGDVMIGLGGWAPVDPQVLLQMERAAPNILASGEPGSGRLFDAIAQRLYDGGAPNVASHVLNLLTQAADQLVAAEHGADSLEAARALNNTAAVAGIAYPTDESVARLEKAVAIRTRLLGAAAPDTAIVMHNLAAVRAARGETGEALRLARAAHNALLGKLGASDRRTIAAALGLGTALADDGDAVQGAPILRAAEAELARAAPGSPQLARAYLDRARIDPALAPTDRVALLDQAARILEADDGAALLAPLRTMLAQAKGYPGGIFLIENDKAKVQDGNAQEIALLDRFFTERRKAALAGAYQRIAREMLDQKRYAEATSMAQKSLKLDAYNDAARVIPVYAAISEQAMSQPIEVMALNAVQVMVLNYEQSGRALSPEVVEAHLMLGLSGMKSYGPMGAVGEFDKAAGVVKQRLTARSNFDAKARRDLDSLRPVFRGQVMVNYAAASQLAQ